MQRQPGAGRRPQQVTSTVATIIVVLVVLCCGGAGLIYALSSSDEEPDKAAAADVPAAPSPAASTSSAPPPSPSPSGDVPGYLAGLKAINTRLATDQDTAVTRGRNTCLDIEQGKPRSTVVNNARQRFAGTVAVSAAMAGKIVDVAQKYLCPSTAIAADPPPTPTEGDENGGATDGGNEVYYKNCAAVEAAGKAPLRRGQPGYRSGLDSDGDGVACES